jgi:prepilin-type N-terminal cleavage/methylation domain-containing protein/prepilin-type processing-associated H-X9-DG protein
MSRTARERGFTLIELLVVIAVLSILIGLLMPAVQRAREAANRTKCMNNLKQIALACNLYENATGRFPPTCPKGETQSWAWIILPQLEQQNLYNQWSLGTAIYNVNNTSALVTPVPVYFCPSRRDPRGAGASVVSVSIKQNASKYTTACGGMSTSDPTVTLSTPTAVGDYAAAVGTTGSDAVVTTIVNGVPLSLQPTGAFVIDTGLRTVDFTDGLTHTLLVGEKHIPRGAELVDPFDCSLYDGHNTYCSTRSAGPGFPIAQGPTDRRLVFGGPHPGLCQFAFADGGVRPVRASIDEFTLGLLSHRSDGLPAPADY